MKHLILLLAFLPILAEVFIDKGLWKKGKDDKPISTILRYVIFAGLSVIFMIFGIITWWQALVLMVVTHAAFFDFAINKSRGLGWFYHPDTNWWDKIWGGIAGMRFGKITYVLLRLFIYWIGWIVAFHWSWISTGDTPDNYIDYFRF
jgi:hypothetical protein